MYQEICGNIYDIQKFSVHDGPGIRTDIFLKGCPLRCLWCHSPESQTFGPDVAFMDIRCIGTRLGCTCIEACTRGAISESRPQKNPADGTEIIYPVIDRKKCDVCLKCVEVCPSEALYNTLRRMTVEECMKPIRQDTRYYQKSGGGVTISGGEPMAQFEFAYALARQCKSEGYHVALDTTGYAPTEYYMQILPYVDLFLYDLKCMDSERSRKLVGVPNELILKNARALADAGGRFQIRYPVIPRLNDDEKNARATAAFCAEIAKSIDLVQLLPYHRLGEMKYVRLGKRYPCSRIEPPTAERMQKMLELFQEYKLPAQVG